MVASQKIRVAVVGATGLAGQEFLYALQGHPSFEVTALAASSRSAGKSYVDAISQENGQVSWYAEGHIPTGVKDLVVQEAKQLELSEIDLVFSCVESAPARELEPRYAEKVPVISTASAFRREDDVPLIIPGLNMDHLPLVREQQKRRNWKGFVLPNPNCTTVGLAMTLAPLHKAFGVKQVHMVSLQAVNGAGRSPGVIALDVVDNVIPFIPGEEEKVEWETQKILGTFDGKVVTPGCFGVSSTCTRIAVLEGHTEVVHVVLDKPASSEQISAAWREFGADFVANGYPTAPEQLIVERSDPFRPQVRIDRVEGAGMSTVVGRLRSDENLEKGWKYVLVSHNTKMGAAQGCILLAEHLHATGYLA